VDFYIRLFIRVIDSPIKCHNSILNYSSVYQCIDCEAYYMQPQARIIEEVIKTDVKTGKTKKYKH
jgi:tRNA (guanine26-N2/guanine27-N2)-dimethyltransferase